jgi:hypothetical protein
VTDWVRSHVTFLELCSCITLSDSVLHGTRRRTAQSPGGNLPIYSFGRRPYDVRLGLDAAASDSKPPCYHRPTFQEPWCITAALNPTAVTPQQPVCSSASDLTASMRSHTITQQLYPRALNEIDADTPLDTGTPMTTHMVCDDTKMNLNGLWCYPFWLCVAWHKDSGCWKSPADQHPAISMACAPCCRAGPCHRCRFMQPA